MNRRLLLSKVESAFRHAEKWQRRKKLYPMSEMDVESAIYYHLVRNGITPSDIHLNYTLRPRKRREFLKKIRNKKFTLVDIYIERDYGPFGEGEEEPDVLIEIKKFWYPGSVLSPNRKKEVERDLTKLFWLSRIYPGSTPVMMVFASTRALGQIADYAEVMQEFDKRFSSVRMLWNK